MILFFYGADTFRSKEKIKQLKERFINEVDKTGMNLAELDGEKISLDDLNKAVATRSFLSNKRMIVIENFLQRPKKIQLEVLEFLKKGKYRDKQDENMIVFWEAEIMDKEKKSELFKFLQQSKFSQEFKALQGRQLVDWIIQRVEERGTKISRQNAEYLAQRSDGNLWALNNEINRLVAVKQGGEISRVEVEQSYLIHLDDNIFNLTDAVAMKDKVKALSLIENQFAKGVKGGYLLVMLVRQFRLLIQVRSCLENGLTNYRQIAAQLGQAPFVVRKVLSQVNKYSLDSLKLIYRQLLKVDASLKSSADARLMLELFILSI